MKPSEFNHIILPMRDELLGYARSVTRSEDNAEDLVREVMLRLWDMRERLRSEGRLKSARHDDGPQYVSGPAAT